MPLVAYKFLMATNFYAKADPTKELQRRLNKNRAT